MKKNIHTYFQSFTRAIFIRIKASKIGYRLVRGMFWTMCGVAVSRGLMLVALLFVARILGRTGYGEFGIIQSTVSVFGVFAGFGLGLTTTKHVAEYRYSDPERAGRIIGLSGLVAIIVGGIFTLGIFIFAPWLAKNIINAPHLTNLLRIGALSIFMNALNGTQNGALSGLESFKAVAYVNFFVGLISFPIIVCGAYFGGLVGAVWALVINLCLNLLINHLVLYKEAHRHKISFVFRECCRELSVLWQFSLPSFLSGALMTPVIWVCNVLLVKQPDGYTELGIFSATLVFQQMLLFASGMMHIPLISIVANAGPIIPRKLGTVNILITWIFGVLVAIPLLCFPEMARMLLGANFYTRSFDITFSIVIFYTTMTLFTEGIARLLVTNNLLWLGFLSNLFRAIISIGSAVFLVRWGAPGLAVSFAISFILSSMVFLPLYYSRKLIPKGILFSTKTVSIWFLFCGLVVLNLANVSLLFRSLIFVISILITVIVFAKITIETAKLR